MHGDATGPEDELALHVVVLEAIDAAAARGDASISAVAAELGIDRSGASRLVGRTLDAGFARRATAPRDARRADLSITPSGRRVLAAARRWQAATFRELVDDWPPDDVERFSRYLVRLAGDVLEVGDAKGPRRTEPA
jgi:DNA-binding MarR family transcriptional regulator